MNPRAKEIKPLQDYTLEILFSNNERKKFDVKPYLNRGIFKSLEDSKLFQTAHADHGTVVWNNGLDLCPDTLYMESNKLDD